MKQFHSWEITDEFWAAAEPLIPSGKRDPAKEYRRRPGGGRHPLQPRMALEGIFYVLRTAIPWDALPRQFGSPSPVYRCFRRWCAAGFFVALWHAGVLAYDEAKGIAWAWVSGDGCMPWRGKPWVKITPVPWLQDTPEDTQIRYFQEDYDSRPGCRRIIPFPEK